MIKHFIYHENGCDHNFIEAWEQIIQTGKAAELKCQCLFAHSSFLTLITCINHEKKLQTSFKTCSLQILKVQEKIRSKVFIYCLLNSCKNNYWL